MSNTATSEENPKNLVVEVTGWENLGRCYNATYYRVLSWKPLTDNHINFLRESGFLGGGQEFSYSRGENVKINNQEYYVVKATSKVDSSD